jgi:hypothetical protein
MLARSVVDPKLERHVHPVKLTGARRFQSRKIMDAEFGVPDQLADLVEPIRFSPESDRSVAILGR